MKLIDYAGRGGRCGGCIDVEGKEVGSTWARDGVAWCEVRRDREGVASDGRIGDGWSGRGKLET